MMLRSDVGTDENAVFRVQANGAVYADGAYAGTGADYAEYFANEEIIPVKSLAGLDSSSGKVRGYKAGDKLIGVASANAGFIGNSTSQIENDPTYTLVGLMGQVDVNSEEIKIIDGTAYTLDGIQVGHNLVGGKMLIDISYPETGIKKLTMAFNPDGALVLGAGSRLYSKTEGLLALEGSLEILKNLYVKGKFVTPASEIQYLSTDSSISPNASKVKVAGKDSPIILTGEEISKGEDGQNVIIQGTDDVNTITIQSRSVLPEAIIRLGQTNRILGKGDVLTISYDAADSTWYEVGYADN
jgi:hypothetical protein